jgi:hypothetical protein
MFLTIEERQFNQYNDDIEMRREDENHYVMDEVMFEDVYE